MSKQTTINDVAVTLEQWRVRRSNGRVSSTLTWGVTVDSTGEVLAEGWTSQRAALDAASDVLASR